MKIIFDCYKDGFFEFIELPISKDSRRILINKNVKDMYYHDIQHPIELCDLINIICRAEC